MTNEPSSTGPTPSIWSSKPWWCQPWTIVLTGVAVVGISWWLLELWWISAALAAGVAVWWWLFLVLVPSAYAHQPEEPS